MTGTFVTCAALMLAGVISSSSLAVAEDAITHPASKTIGASSSEMVASLGVINADGTTLEGGKLTLTGVSPNTIVFADRPVRAAGHVLTAHFLREWDEGQESFAKTPPNATISVFSKDGTSVKDAVVILKTPSDNFPPNSCSIGGEQNWGSVSCKNNLSPLVSDCSSVPH